MSAGGGVTVEEAAASAIKHVTDGIDDEEAMNRAPDLLAALAAAGWAVVPVEATEAEVKAASSTVRDLFDWTADGRICNSVDQKWAVEAREEVVRAAINASRKP